MYIYNPKTFMCIFMRTGICIYNVNSTGAFIYYVNWWPRQTQIYAKSQDVIARRRHKHQARAFALRSLTGSGNRL